MPFVFDIKYKMMLGSKGTNPIVLAQIGFGTCDPPEHEEVAIPNGRSMARAACCVAMRKHHKQRKGAFDPSIIKCFI